MHMTIPKEWGDEPQTPNTTVDENGNPITNPNPDGNDGKEVDWKERYDKSLPEAQYNARVAKCVKPEWEKEFIKFYESNRKWAERFAKEFWYSSADSLYSTLKEKYGHTADPKKSEDEWSFSKEKVEEVVSKRLMEERAKDTYESELSRLNVDPESEKGKELISTYEDLIKGRQRTPDNVKKYLKIALKAVDIDDEPVGSFGKGSKTPSNIPSWPKKVSEWYPK